MIFLNSSFKFHLRLYLIVLFLIYYFDGFVRNIKAQSSSPTMISPQSYTQRDQRPFHAGDAVEISIYPDTTSFLHRVFPIDGEGFVTLPLKGRVKITDMSQEEFEKYINENYKQYLRVPEVKARPLIRASLLGGFNVPGLYYIDQNSTLWQLVQRAQGTILEDGLKKMKWERNKKELADNLIPYFESGKSLQEIGFRTGDQLWVPSPGRRGFLETASLFLPFFTVAITGYTMYLTYSLTFSR